MLNILVVGSGAREHIIAEKLQQASQEKQLFCWGTNNNPGIKSLCQKFCSAGFKDNQPIVEFAKKNNIDFAIIGPELPLANGLVDDLQAAGIRCIGPNQQLAKIETSKGFARELTTQYNIPGSPQYFYFTELDGVAEVLNQLGEHYVIKADGLMGGKGVKLSGEHLHSQQEAIAYCEEILAKGQNFVIEEKFVGEEFSLISLVSNQQLAHMPAVQDHKRAFINDTGPNTGGMGTYTAKNHRLPFLAAEDITAAQQINEQVAAALQQHCQANYCGILYGSFMLTATGIKLIEYNARFGDPEAMNLLTLLENDFLEVCLAMLNNQLADIQLSFKPQATVCKYLVPQGYPDNPEKNQPIQLGELPPTVKAYFAAIDQQADQLIMTGSRALALVSQAETIAQAATNIEQAIKQIQGNVFHRPDIGNNELINKRIQHINQLCQRDYQLL